MIIRKNSVKEGRYNTCNFKYYYCYFNCVNDSSYNELW